MFHYTHGLLFHERFHLSPILTWRWCFMLEQLMKVYAYITDKSAQALTDLKLQFEIA